MGNQTADQQARRIVLSLLKDLSHAWTSWRIQQVLSDAEIDGRICGAERFFSAVEFQATEYSMLALTRLTKRSSSSVSIYYLLNHADANPQAYPLAPSDAALRGLVSDSLGRLEAIRATGDANAPPLAGILETVRDRAIAHTDKQWLRPEGIGGGQSLAFELAQFEEYLASALEIINALGAWLDPPIARDLSWIDAKVPGEIDYLLSLMRTDRGRTGPAALG